MEIKNILPKHVELTRSMLFAILNDNGLTSYKHSNGPVHWGNYKNNGYISITDCSGYINALLKKAYKLSIGWPIIKRPYTSTYYDFIQGQKNFTKITNINQALIGDFIVFKIPPHTSKNNNTGHIMLINNLPINIVDISPLISNTKQWIVNIIDQSSAHGNNDSRYNSNSTGLGTGYLRIYTGNNDILNGYAWSTKPDSMYYSKLIHPLIIGRLSLVNNINIQ